MLNCLDVSEKSTAYIWTSLVALKMEALHSSENSKHLSITLRRTLKGYRVWKLRIGYISFGNVCYHLVQNYISPLLLSKNVNIKARHTIWAYIYGRES